MGVRQNQTDKIPKEIRTENQIHETNTLLFRNLKRDFINPLSFDNIDMTVFPIERNTGVSIHFNIKQNKDSFTKKIQRSRFW